MVDAHDGSSGDDELAPRHVLEAYAVPELPFDFTDRVMGSLQASAVIPAAPRRSTLPWTIAGCATLVALAAALMLVWIGRERIVVPEPSVAVAAPPVVYVPTPLPAAAPARGHLVLSVDPHDAIVRVDGRTITGPSPFVATNLAIGDHAIDIERDGYVAWSRRIDVPSGELDLPISLVALPTAAVAPVRTPSKAKSSGGSPDLMDPFRKGDEGDAPADPLASTESGKSVDLTFDMKDPWARADKTDAVLRIGTTPGERPAQIFVDGKAVGLTPIAGFKVAPGKHVIRWRWADGREVRRTVTVEAGEMRVIREG